jgi:hypothetical protein
LSPTDPLTTTAYLYVDPSVSDEDAIKWLCNEVEKRMLGRKRDKEPVPDE